MFMFYQELMVFDQDLHGVRQGLHGVHGVHEVVPPRPQVTTPMLCPGLATHLYVLYPTLQEQVSATLVKNQVEQGGK